MTDDISNWEREAKKMDVDRKSFLHRRGDPDIVHTDPPKTCACNKRRV